MGRGIKISWIAVGQNTMDREVKVTSVRGLKYHGYGAQHTMCKGINIPWVELQFRIYCYNVMQMYIKSYEAIILYNSIVFISIKIRKL